MRIEGMDAAATRVQDSGYEVKTSDAKDIGHIKADKAEYSASIQQKSQDKNELSVSEKAVIEAIEKANKAIFSSNRVLEFSIHEKTKEIMVKVVDSETKEIIREIPPEKVLDMVAKLWEMAGILVDERR